jgi:hypothetical protein
MTSIAINKRSQLTASRAVCPVCGDVMEFMWPGEGGSVYRCRHLSMKKPKEPLFMLVKDKGWDHAKGNV